MERECRQRLVIHQKACYARYKVVTFRSESVLLRWGSAESMNRVPFWFVKVYTSFPFVSAFKHVLFFFSMLPSSLLKQFSDAGDKHLMDACIKRGC